MKSGRMDLDGDIQADGGSTAGIIGGLLGPRPRIIFEAARRPTAPSCWRRSTPADRRWS
jgi:hypothetical protein